MLRNKSTALAFWSRFRRARTRWCAASKRTPRSGGNKWTIAATVEMLARLAAAVHALLFGEPTGMWRVRAATVLIILAFVLAMVYRRIRSRAADAPIADDTSVKVAVVNDDKGDVLLEAPVCRPCRHSCRATSRTYRQVSYRVSESA